MRLAEDWELKDCWERFGMSRTTFYHYKKKRDDMVKETGTFTTRVKVNRNGRAPRLSDTSLENIRDRIVTYAEENNCAPLEIPNTKVNEFIRDQLMMDSDDPNVDLNFPESLGKRVKYSFGFTGRQNVIRKKSKPSGRGPNPYYLELLNNDNPTFAKDVNQRVKEALKMYDDYYAGLMPPEWKLHHCYEKAGIKRTAFWSHKQKRDKMRERGEYYDVSKLKMRGGRPDLLSDNGVQNIRNKIFAKSAELDMSVNHLGAYVLPYLVEVSV